MRSFKAQRAARVIPTPDWWSTIIETAKFQTPPGIRGHSNELFWGLNQDEPAFETLVGIRVYPNDVIWVHGFIGSRSFKPERKSRQFSSTSL
jgi:hypothetical protein